MQYSAIVTAPTPLIVVIVKSRSRMPCAMSSSSPAVSTWNHFRFGAASWTASGSRCDPNSTSACASTRACSSVGGGRKAPGAIRSVG